MTYQGFATAVGAIVVSVVAGIGLAGILMTLRDEMRRRRAWNDHLFGSK